MAGSQSTLYAFHIFGGDFYYEHVSGTTYKVSMVLYGDCTASSFGLLPGAQPQIQLKDGASVVSTFSLAIEGAGVEVTPVCEADKNNTRCKVPTSIIPGVTRFRYSANVTVPYASADWHFFFTGEFGNSQAGRTTAISNIVNNGSSIMVMDASLNNLAGPNSSPRFTTIPTPFYCINVAQQYNPGAVDADGDSLYYSLAPALVNGGTVSYQPGYSASAPLSVAPGSFIFNNITGQLNFTPNATQISTVVTQADEYRNGVKVGSATREMNFVVLANCTGNTLPEGRLDTASFAGLQMVGPRSFVFCEGSGPVSLTIQPRGAPGDTINVTLAGLPAGITSTITGNNTTTPNVLISGANNGATPAGNYTFYLTYKDSHCPISSQQTEAYSIQVIRPNNVKVTTLYPTNCVHKAYVQYTLTDGTTPRSVTISQGNTVVRTFTDNTGVFRDSMAVGNYSIRISSLSIPCITEKTFTVSDSGTFPYPPAVVDAFYCLNDPAMPLASNAPTYPGATLYWIDTLNNFLTTAPVPNTTVPSITRWITLTKYKTCESVRDTGFVYVTKRPVADFSFDPAQSCDRDTVTVLFTGTIGVGPIIDYQWGWAGSNSVTGPLGGPYRVHWPIPGSKVVTLRVLENQCPSDTVRKTYTVKPTPVASFAAGNICQYDSMNVAYTATPLPGGQSYAWSFDGADLPASTAPGPFLLHWAAGGTKRLSLIVSKDGCADTSFKNVQVYELPKAEILNVPGVTCLGDEVLLEYADAAGAAITWTPKGQVYYRREDGRPYIVTNRPTTYTLTLTNKEGCIDSASVTYNRIEPCCNFSYPNAFTPNGDGHNDVFRVVTYGNDAGFSLSIFNRWGQTVYHSGNPKEGWDGRLNGKDCDMGTYFYILKAQCLTGHQEYQQGEFSLIR